MSEAIKVNHVSHSFKEKNILSGVNLEIKKGRFLDFLDHREQERQP